jgi:hypothetical protein
LIDLTVAVLPPPPLELAPVPPPQAAKVIARPLIPTMRILERAFMNEVS